MSKKTFMGTIPTIPETDIYLNVNHLEKGNYKLKIVHNNRIIKSTIFKKNN